MAERFRIGLPETALPFIPPADKFLEYLGRPGGLAGLINMLGNQLDQPLPDPKTVRKAIKEGVSPRSFNQIKSILESVSTPEMNEYIAGQYLAPWMETTLRQNGLAWLCMVRGQHLKTFQNKQTETLAEKFVKDRAEKELELLQVRQEIQNNAETTVSEERWRETLNDFLLRNTRVESTHIVKGLETWMALKTRKDQPNKEQVGLLLGLYTRLRIDFYYQLLCNISLDLIRWFKEKGTLGEHDGKWLVQDGFFGDMVPAFDGESLMLPFESLLDTWREGAGPNDSDLSWAKVSQYLPDPYGLDEKTSRAPNQTVEERTERIRKNKESRLREWRYGTRPEPEQLSQFVRNLSRKEDDVPLALMRLDIACIWGSYILDELATFERYGLMEALHETLPAFERFPAYWADYQAQAAQIVAA
jgi:hypothetical protein